MDIGKMLKVLNEEFKMTNFIVEETENRLIVKHDNEYYGRHASIDERIDFMNKVKEICNSDKNFVMLYDEKYEKETKKQLKK